MPLNPGNDTITFIHQSLTGTPDKYGVIAPTQTTSVVGGCALQPISERDKISDTTYSEATDHCITPVTSFVLTILADDFLQDAAGVKYRILGVRPYRDFWGRNDHVTFVCKYEVG